MKQHKRKLKGNTSHEQVLTSTHRLTPVHKTEINLLGYQVLVYNLDVVVFNFFFFFFLVAIRTTSVAGQLYFIVDMADLWLQTHTQKNPKLKCSHMLRTYGGYRNEDNDLKCMTAALKSLSHEYRDVQN